MRAESFAAGAAIGDEHYLAIEALIDEHRPVRVVLDPITALVKSGGQEIADTVTERLAMLCKARGITAIFAAVSDSNNGEMETTPTRVSTVADTWIHLSFAAQQGERNRTMTLIEARDSAHSNQLREVVLSSDGVTLADVYSSGGSVLLGTARLRHEQEAAESREQSDQQRFVELQNLDEERDTLSRDVDDMLRRVSRIDEHRVELVSRTARRSDVTLADSAAVREARFADPEETSGVSELW